MKKFWARPSCVADPWLILDTALLVITIYHCPGLKPDTLSAKYDTAGLGELVEDIVPRGCCPGVEISRVVVMDQTRESGQNTSIPGHAAFCVGGSNVIEISMVSTTRSIVIEMMSWE